MAALVSADVMACDTTGTAFFYLETLGRGGLTWPMQELVNVVVKVFCIIPVFVVNSFMSNNF